MTSGADALAPTARARPPVRDGRTGRPARPAGPLMIGVEEDCEIVTKGLAKMLEPFAQQVRLVQRRPAGDESVDITLIDPYMGARDGSPRALVDRALRDPRNGAIVIYTWESQEAPRRTGLTRSVRGFLPKSLTGAELVEALAGIGRGDRVHLDARPTPDDADDPVSMLTPREFEVLSLITRGYRNDEIAERLYLSINSVKSYIRSAYRKIDVGARTQAVLWGISHGLDLGPEPDGTSPRAAQRRSDSGRVTALRR